MERIGQNSNSRRMEVEHHSQITPKIVLWEYYMNRLGLINKLVRTGACIRQTRPKNMQQACIELSKLQMSGKTCQNKVSQDF